MAVTTGLVLAGVSAAAAAKGSIDARKAQKESLALQKEAMTQGASGGISGNPQTGQVDIQALDQLTREMARKNALESAQLEQELNPEVASLRRQSIEALQGDLSPDAYDQATRAGLLSDFAGAGRVGQSQLSRDVYSRAAEDLALGSSIPQDVQNLITRRAAAQSGRVGGGLELGRDITARDLGLTSLDLMNNRLNVAQGVGAQTDAFNLNADQMRAQQRLQNAGLIANMGNADVTRRLAIANLSQGIDQPISGLDPGAAAALAVGNTSALQSYLANQQALAAQNKNASNEATGQLLGQLPGLVGAVGGLFNKTPTSTYTSPYTSLPSFNTTLGYNPPTTTGAYGSVYTPTYTTPSFTTTQGQYGSVYTPQFSPNTNLFCWVARSAYGPCNPKWRQFRGWMLNRAPSVIRKAYGRFGPSFAKWLDRHAQFKPAVRYVMDAILEAQPQPIGG